MARRFLIDLTPLRTSSDFRRLFYGQTVSMVGSQFTMVATAFQVYSLTHSSLQVGLISLVQLVPFVMGTLLGGVLGDAIDRRRLMVLSSLTLGFTSGGLAFNAASGHQASVLVIYVISAVAAFLSGVLATVVTATIASLVTPTLLSPAYATMQIIDQVGMVTGPALSGLLIAGLGILWLYAIDAVTFIWTTAFLWTMATAPAIATTRQPGLQSVLEGLGYIRTSQELKGAFLIDLFATVFGLPRALFPALARNVFHGGPAILGILYAVPAAGAFAGSLLSGRLAGIKQRGRAVVIAVVVWGAVIVTFGFSKVLVISLILLGIAGWSDVVSAILRSTIVQSSTSDGLRGRVSAVQMAVVEGGPRLGDFESGGIANALSTQFSIVSGGLTCIIGAIVLALLLPKFRKSSTTD